MIHAVETIKVIRSRTSTLRLFTPATLKLRADEIEILTDCRRYLAGGVVLSEAWKTTH
jgi:hypothetical protein